MKTIKYKKGFKYILKQELSLECEIIPIDIIIDAEFVHLTCERLTIMKGYAWDGASGPTIDTANTIFPSLVHDALYQLMREGYLDPDIYRMSADKLFLELLEREGMSYIRRTIWFKMIRKFGSKFAEIKN